jgi:hypothetical protein
VLQEIKMRQYKGWIGVDLDGTLAHYDHWRGIAHIGEPIAPMLSLVNQWVERGEDVRIFTARVSQTDTMESIRAKQFIQDWCQLHVGRVLPVTNVKDFDMAQLWDDRAVRVIFNTGITCCGLKGFRP